MQCWYNAGVTSLLPYFEQTGVFNGIVVPVEGANSFMTCLKEYSELTSQYVFNPIPGLSHFIRDLCDGDDSFMTDYKSSEVILQQMNDSLDEELKQILAPITVRYQQTYSLICQPNCPLPRRRVTVSQEQSCILIECIFPENPQSLAQVIYDHFAKGDSSPGT